MERSASSEARTSGGKMTRTLMRRPCWRIEEEASPDMAVVTAFAMSVAFRPTCAARCYLECDGWATDDDAALGINHAWNFLNRFFDLISFLMERGSVFAEELDFDWFRRAGQLPDHVRQNA